MNAKFKKILLAIGLTLVIAIIWVAFLHITSLGVLLWFASSQFEMAMFVSIIFPVALFSIFVLKNKEQERKFLYLSLVGAGMLMLFVHEPVERAFLGLLILPIILVLSWFRAF